MTTLTQSPMAVEVPTLGRTLLGAARMILKGISDFAEWIWPTEPDFTFEKWNQLENRRLLATRIGEQMNAFPIR